MGFPLLALGAGIGGLGLGALAGSAFKGEATLPNAPAFQLPGFAQGIPEEILALIRSQIGAQVPVPQEFGQAQQLLTQLAGVQPEQFRFPVQAIQDALAAQQAQQFGQFQKQVRPLAAAQGQLESTGFTNLISDFLRGQQTQALGTTADLLTQEAQQNLQLQQFFPQFRAGIAGQLAGLGGQQAGLSLQNIQLPFQTTIPALGNVFSQGLNLGQAQFQGALPGFQQQLQQQQQQQAQQQALFQGLGSFAGAGLTGGLGGLLPGGGGFGQGALRGLAGISPSQSQFFNALGTGGFGGTSRFPFQFASPGTQSLGGGTFGAGTPFGTIDLGGASLLPSGFFNQ